MRRQIHAADNVVAGDEEALAEWQRFDGADIRTPTGLRYEQDQQTGEEGYGARAPGPMSNASCQNAADGWLGAGELDSFSFLASDAGSGCKPVGDVRSPSDPTTLSWKLPVLAPPSRPPDRGACAATRHWDGRAQLNTATDPVQQPIYRTACEANLYRS